MYQFGFGVHTLSPTQTKVFQLKYSYNNNNNFYFGGLFSFGSEEFRTIRTYKDPAHHNLRNSNFLYKHLLSNEDEVGSKLLPISEMIITNFNIGPNLTFQLGNKSFLFVQQVALLMSVYNFQGIHSIEYISTSIGNNSKGIMFVPFYKRGMSGSLLYSVEGMYNFKNGFTLGLENQFDFDPFIGGIRIITTLNIGIKFKS